MPDATPRSKRERQRRSGGAAPRPKMTPRILGEHDGVIVVDKPAGMTTASKDARDDTVLAHVRRWLQAARPDARVWVVHRLDRDASGLVLFASTSAAYGWLKEDLRANRVRADFAAIVRGTPAWEGEHTLVDELHDGPQRRVVAVANGRAPASDATATAVTHARVECTGKGRALLALRMDTSRRHQLRVQLAHAGHAILGDRLYGPERQKPRHDARMRLCLHATRLELRHPTTGQAMTFESPPPKRFATLVDAGRDAPKPATDSEATPPGTTAAETPSEPAPKPARPQQRDARGWDHVAAWYDKLVGEGRSDHHSAVIVPGTLRLLGLERGERLLDVACGEGVLARAAAELGAAVVGVDASAGLIDAARQRARGRETYLVGDAQNLAHVEGLRDAEPFDAASCVMALMNIEAIEAAFRGIRTRLRPGGRFVAIVLHPAFRAPGRTGWGWDEEGASDGIPSGPAAQRRRQPGAMRQYRRVDAYLTPHAQPIVMNPGAAAHGRRAITTTTHHRPLQDYIAALARCGFAIDALEEWPSQRTSEPGPRADAENRARREIPMFLGLRAIAFAAT
ncbi:MAG: pseudouridine synthase [Planctomycetota bacterium]